MASIANTPLGFIPPLQAYRLPKAVANLAQPPVFGRDLYSTLGNSKIVINGAIDMAGLDRGNMRCWEAMGCGALMLADVGNYPAYMEDGKNMITYSNVDDMVNKIAWFLDHEAERREIAQSGTTMLVQHYSKERQWNDFVSLL